MSNEKALVHQEWHKDLVIFLKDVVWCEKCGTTDPGPPGKFDHAHRKKRRFIGYQTQSDHDEYMMAAKLCRKCHTGLDENWNNEASGDFDAHQIMYDIITNIVNNRSFDYHVA